MFSWTLPTYRSALSEQSFTCGSQGRFRSVLRLHLLGLALIWSPSAAAQTLYLDPQFGFERTGSVVYAEKPAGSPAVNMDLLLELFQPTGPNIPPQRPGIILVHGGGFTSGSRLNARLISMCEEMATRGWTCVSIDYRLAGDEPVLDPAFEIIETVVTASGESANATAVAAATEDAWAATQWMINHAGDLGVDPERIGIGGSSAGAVTSLLVGYLLDDIGVSAKGDLDAVFDMWGSVGGNPIMVQGDDPPLLIAHGEDDPTVPVSGAYALRDQAEAVGLPYEIHVFPGVGHGFNIFTMEVSPGEFVFDRFVAFFYQHVAQPVGVAVPSSSVGSIAALVLLLAAMGFALLPIRKPTL
ncbi:MAG: alpha/beta hydrolase [Myxococcota bacterium]